MGREGEGGDIVVETVDLRGSGVFQWMDIKMTRMGKGCIRRTRNQRRKRWATRALFGRSKGREISV